MTDSVGVPFKLPRTRLKTPTHASRTQCRHCDCQLSGTGTARFGAHRDRRTAAGAAGVPQPLAVGGRSRGGRFCGRGLPLAETRRRPHAAAAARDSYSASDCRGRGRPGIRIAADSVAGPGLTGALGCPRPAAPAGTAKGPAATR